MRGRPRDSPPRRRSRIAPSRARRALAPSGLLTLQNFTQARSAGNAALPICRTVATPPGQILEESRMTDQPNVPTGAVDAGQGRAAPALAAHRRRRAGARADGCGCHPRRERGLRPRTLGPARLHWRHGRPARSGTGGGPRRPHGAASRHRDRRHAATAGAAAGHRQGRRQGSLPPAREGAGQPRACPDAC